MRIKPKVADLPRRGGTSHAPRRIRATPGTGVFGIDLKSKWRCGVADGHNAQGRPEEGWRAPAGLGQRLVAPRMLATRCLCLCRYAAVLPTRPATTHYAGRLCALNARYETPAPPAAHRSPATPSAATGHWKATYRSSRPWRPPAKRAARAPLSRTGAECHQKRARARALAHPPPPRPVRSSVLQFAPTFTLARSGRFFILFFGAFCFWLWALVVVFIASPRTALPVFVSVSSPASPCRNPTTVTCSVCAPRRLAVCCPPSAERANKNFWLVGAMSVWVLCGRDGRSPMTMPPGPKHKQNSIFTPLLPSRLIHNDSIHTLVPPLP